MYYMLIFFFFEPFLSVKVKNKQPRKLKKYKIWGGGILNFLRGILLYK